MDLNIFFLWNSELGVSYVSNCGMNSNIGVFSAYIPTQIDLMTEMGRGTGNTNKTSLCLHGACQFIKSNVHVRAALFGALKFLSEQNIWCLTQNRGSPATPWTLHLEIIMITASPGRHSGNCTILFWREGHHEVQRSGLHFLQFNWVDHSQNTFGRLSFTFRILT